MWVKQATVYLSEVIIINRIIVGMSYFLYNVSVNDTGIIFIMEGLKNSMLIYLA